MNLLNIFAALTLNSAAYEKGLKDAESKAQGFGGELSGILSGVGSLAMQAGAAAVAAIGAAVVDLTTKAVQGYSEYEQLVGGVETLFGAGGRSIEEYAASVGKSVDEVRDEYDALIEAQNLVMTNADNAWKTAGLSANNYMETVTGFSASLLQSLGGDTLLAAEYSDKAVQDMSDNANKMGTDMSSIQRAYQGFAKQNYTMLDNLKLGYGGTKTEMMRLVEDAEALNSSFQATRDENGNLVLSYADIIDAIHIVQDNMGITGTTAKEASQTITGSLSAMQAAWDNLLVTVAKDDGDIGGSVSILADSVLTVAQNIVPRVITTLTGIGDALSTAVPELLNTVVQYVMGAAPDLLSAVVDLALGIVNTVVENAPLIVSAAYEAVTQVIGQVSSLLPDLIPMVITTVTELAAYLISDGVPILIDAAANLVDGLYTGIFNGVDALVSALPQLLEAFGSLLTTAWPKLFDMITGLVRKVTEVLPKVLKTLMTEVLPTAITVIGAFVMDFLPELINTAMELVQMLVGVAPELITTFFTALFEDVYPAAMQLVVDMIPAILDSTYELIMALVSALPDLIVPLAEAIPEVVIALITAWTTLLPMFVELVAKTVLTIAQAFPRFWATVVSAVVNLVVKLGESAKNLWPKFVEAAQTWVENIKTGFTDTWHKIVEEVQDIVKKLPTKLKDALGKIGEVGEDLVKGLWNGISNTTTWLMDKIKGFGEGILGGLKDFFGIHSPSTVMEKIIGKNLVEGVAEGIEKYGDDAVDAMDDFSKRLLGAAEVDPDYAMSGGDIYSGVGTRKRVSGGGIVQNIYASKMTPAEVFEEARIQQERVALLGV